MRETPSRLCGNFVFLRVLPSLVLCFWIVWLNLLVLPPGDDAAFLMRRRWDEAVTQFGRGIPPNRCPLCFPLVRKFQDFRKSPSRLCGNLRDFVKILPACAELSGIFRGNPSRLCGNLAFREPGGRPPSPSLTTVLVRDHFYSNLLKHSLTRETSSQHWMTMWTE